MGATVAQSSFNLAGWLMLQTTHQVSVASQQPLQNLGLNPANAVLALNPVVFGSGIPRCAAPALPRAGGGSGASTPIMPGWCPGWGGGSGSLTPSMPSGVVVPLTGSACDAPTFG